MKGPVTITIEDYMGEETVVELELEDVSTIDVEVLTGDQVLYVTDKDGSVTKYDSSDCRTRSLHDWGWRLYDSTWPPEKIRQELADFNVQIEEQEDLPYLESMGFSRYRTAWRSKSPIIRDLYMVIWDADEQWHAALLPEGEDLAPTVSGPSVVDVIANLKSHLDNRFAEAISAN